MKLLLIFLFATTTTLAQMPEWSRRYHTGSVTCLDFSSDGGKLLSGGLDKKVVVWNVLNQDSLKVFHFTSAIQSVDSHEDDLLLISTNSWSGYRTGSNTNYLLKLSDTSYRKEIKGLMQFYQGYFEEIHENIAFFRNNEIIAVNSGVLTYQDPSTYSYTCINIFSLDSLILKKAIAGKNFPSIEKEFDIEQASTSISSDKRYLHGSALSFNRPYRGDWTEYITTNIFDFTDLKTISYPHKLYQPLSLSRTVASTFTADSKKLLTATGTGSIYIRDIPSTTLSDSLGSQTSLATALAADMRGRYYFSAHENSNLLIWTPGIPNVFKRIHLQSPVTTIAISPDSVRFATAHADGTVAVWNIDSLAYYAQTDTISTGITEENPFKNIQFSAEPNPFKNSTTIHFSLPKPLQIKLAVTDILGKEIAVLKDEFVESGEQSVVFKNENLPDGIYYITLSGEGLLKTIPVQISR